MHAGSPSGRHSGRNMTPLPLQMRPRLRCLQPTSGTPATARTARAPPRHAAATETVTVTQPIPYEDITVGATLSPQPREFCTFLHLLPHKIRPKKHCFLLKLRCLKLTWGARRGSQGDDGQRDEGGADAARGGGTGEEGPHCQR